MCRMTKNRSSIVIVILLTVANTGRGQGAPQQSGNRPDLRSTSIYIGMGSPQVMALGVQFQIDEEFALGIVTDMVGFGKGGRDEVPFGMGAGIKVSYFLSRTGEDTFLSVNVVNIEESHAFGLFEEGNLAEFAIGHDSIEGGGVGFLWSIGAAFGAPTGQPLVASFAGKIGLHVDW